MRLLATVLALLMLLTGCSPSAKTPAPQESPAVPADQPVELTLGMAFGFPREALDEAISLYEKKHPNVTVKVKELRNGQFMLQDGTPNMAMYEGIDIAILSETFARGLQRAGQTRDLTSQRLPALNPAIADLYDEVSKIDGQRYGLPIVLAPGNYLVNTNAFKQMGIEPPALDWTLQEFEEKLTQLVAAGGNANQMLSLVWEPFMRAFGGSVYDRNTGSYIADTPETRQALAWLARQVQAGILQANQSTTGTFMIGGPQGMALVPNFGLATFSGPGMDLQPLPRGPKGRSAPVSATMGLVLNSTANPEVATDFLMAMVANPETQVAMARAGVRPVTDSSDALAAWQEAVGDRVVEATDLSLQGAYAPANISYLPVIDALRPYLEGKASLDEVLPNAINLNK